jgi:hypothetical protein
MIFLASSAVANHTAFIGGARDGAALGMRTESDLTDKLSFRYGLEGSTGQDVTFASENPLVLFGSLDRYFFKIDNKYPLSLGIGAVVYSGNYPMAGPTIHAVIDNLFGKPELFADLGFDVVNGAQAQCQIGFKIWTTYSPVENPY